MNIIYPDFFKLCEDWTNFFYSEEMENIILSPTIQNIKESTFYPHIDDIFRCFYMTPLKKVKVVIIGQDPYHNGSATGLCFDVKKGNIINPSLQNIYKELENEGFCPTRDGNLEHWARQGVLLLNSALTVEEGEPESHLEHWGDFFKKVLEFLSMQKNLVWIILGKKASEYIPYISKNHKIFEATHPSPYSANNPSKTQKAFLGSGIFKAVNSQLYKNGHEKISW
jgi:uracil-DNA glycosylase